MEVTGLGCRCGAWRSPQEFWRGLLCSVPSTLTRKGASFISFVEDKESFDPQFFGVLPKDARWWTPSRKIMLECAWEAMERSSYLPQELRDSEYGAFLGKVSFLTQSVS